MCGHAGGGIRYGLVSGGLLLDEGETGNTVKRIRLYFEPGIRNVVPTAGTDSVRASLEGRERLLDPAKLVDGEQLHRQGDIEIMFSSGLVDRVGEEFWFCGDQMGRHGVVCKRRTKSLELVPKV